MLKIQRLLYLKIDKMSIDTNNRICFKKKISYNKISYNNIKTKKNYYKSYKMTRTVYLYNISKNFRFNRSYLCLLTKQNSPDYIGELNIDENCNSVSFYHIIGQKNGKIISNEIGTWNKQEFLTLNKEKIFIENNEYYGDTTVEIETLSHENDFDTAIITYLQPSKYCCIGAQDFFYTYVEELTIKDITISFEELLQKLSVVPETMEINVMEVEICTNSYEFMRGNLHSTKIEEYYFPYYNTSINYDNKINIIFNPLTRYHHSNSHNRSSMSEEPKIIKTENVTDKEIILKIYNLLKSYTEYNLAISKFSEDEILSSYLN